MISFFSSEYHVEQQVERVWPQSVPGLSHILSSKQTVLSFVNIYNLLNFHVKR